MKITDQKAKMLFKNFYFISFWRKKVDRKKASLNFVFLKLLQFLDAEEFYHKSTLQTWFETWEGKRSRVERPKKYFFWKLHFSALKSQNFEKVYKTYTKNLANFT